MTINQQIQWVCLPAGFHPDGTLRVSVFVSPRLISDEGNTLALFPDFLDWPARLATAAFQVHTDDPRNPRGPVTMTGPPPDSALWRAFFGPETPLHSYEPDNFESHEVMSYPARRMSAATRTGYAATAVSSPTELPKIETLPYDDESAERFTAFHSRPEPTEETAAVFEMDTAESLREKVDFHQMLSALGDHPTLLRRLGLVFDLALPAERVLQNDLDQAVQLLPSWASLLADEQTTDVRPHTWYVRRPDLFVAAARGSSALGSLSQGVIKLPEDQFSVEQADLDGTVQKALTMDPADDSGFPALRTSGFSLVRDDRATFLADDFGLAARREEDLAAGRAIDLFADDLVRGHRLDVWDESAERWFSLHERTVDYTVPGDPANSAPGVNAEGFFQVSLLQPAGADTSRLYVHERIITWDGWSLSGPRPGKVLSEDPRPPDPGDPATMPKRVPNTAATALPLEIEAAVLSGSLPRLRFGRAYRFRVRTVDLAGNGPGLAEVPDLGPDFRLPGDGPAVFQRFEPVSAPPVLPRARFTEGASTTRLVIRSTPGQSVAEYTAAFNESPLVREGGHPAYAATDERHLVAPKAALQLVEWHGMLDAAIGSADPAVRREMYELARREKGALDDTSLPGVEVVTVTRPDGTEAQRYVLHTGDSVAVPYLPDPLATGVVFHGLPGIAGEEGFALDWDGPQWHRPHSVRLRVADGQGPPEWDEAARVLTVRMPPGAVATVRVSSRTGAGPDLMGVLAWCRDELDAEQFAEVMAAATANRLWMTTPWQDVTLVHAVQRPLTVPQLEFFPGMDRQEGDTYVHLFGSVQLSAATTERIDMIAEWRESVDDLAADGPADRECSAHVFRLPVALAQEFIGDSIPEEVPCKLVGSALTFNTLAAEHSEPPVPARHDFGDTKHRSINYHAVAGSAFREYFPPEFAAADQLSARGEPITFDVLNSAPPSAPRVLYCIPTQRWETAEGPGTITRRRRGGGIRVYLERPWFSSGNGELLGVLVAGETPLPHDEAYSRVSLVGRDPVYDSATLHPLSKLSFPARVVLADDLPLPPDLARMDVAVAGHQPRYDAETKRWFCDIDIDTEDAYFPFVRLALARFQPKSLPGMHLSEIVLTDIVRTMPDRTLTVSTGTPAGAPIGVSVTGPSYVVPEGSRMVARLERRDPAIADEVIGWHLVAGTITDLRPQFTDEGELTAFLGEVPVPARQPGERRRLTVMEYERLPSDAHDGVTSERLVYCDGVEI
jgi:hypothetical protein